ncbi:PWWP domain-containing protein 6 [Lycium barbarum]|uniref:PWWP domain-containing protein 6 n=1 Tax=Lycium barbarum TaxID=112863 RepID=UPI00293F4D34|nr:PWWP domain-containing protein 6 [Lycium barbarum]
MSSDENTEKTTTLAELSAETLMADAGIGPGPGLPGEAPRVSQVDHEPVVNGNVDNGAPTELLVVASGVTAKGIKEVDGDGISLLVDVHSSLENVKGVNGEENAADNKEDEMVDAVDGDTAEDNNDREDEMVDPVDGDTAEDNNDREDEMIDAVDGDTAEDNNDRDDTNVYKVGDFVWGKVTSHPWWPGRVYDSSCAAEKAMKYYRTGSLLVAYFGDFSYSWRPPSQLVSFVNNFEQMSKQSTSKSFLKAVQKAVDEISVLMEFDMCISEDSRAGLSWPLAENGGIRKGVPVPEGVSAVRLLLSQYEPAGILKGLKHLTQNNSNSNVLELAVLKGWLSAFYRAKCGRPLALYCEPVPVEGLEDKKDQDVDANDFSIPIEVPIKGPSEEETPNSGSAKSPKTASDKIYHKRKQKSVAELMGENAKPKGKKKTAEDSTPSSAETSDKKRKKSSEKANSVDEKNGKRASKKSGDTDLAKKKELRVSIPEHDELGNQRDMNASPLSRERKKSKYLSPPYTSPKWNAGKSSFKRELEVDSQKVSDITRMGERMTKAARDLLSSPDANHGNEAVKEKTAERFDDVDKSSRMGKRSSRTSDTMNIDSSVNEVLSEVQSTALNPLSLRNGSVEKAKGFVSSFRNSVYLDGSNYKQYHKKTGNKRKSLDDTKSPESVPSHAKKRKTNKASGASCQGTEDEEVGRETSSAILTVTFSTGVSLPSEDEIIQIYNKFGELNKKETKMLYDSNAVQIVYMHGPDAEEAFKQSVRQNPFGAADVIFTLRNPSPNSEIPLSSLIASKGKKSEVKLIKQKLKGMATLLEKCKGKITIEEKLELESEIKGLLEKVSTVPTSTNP